MRNTLDSIAEEMNKSFFVALMGSLLLYFFMLLIAGGLVAGVISTVWGIDPLSIGEYPTPFRLLQAFNQILTWGFVGWVMIRVIDMPYAAFSVSLPNGVWQILLAIALILIAVPMVEWSTFNADTFSLPESLSAWEKEMEAWEEKAEESLTMLLGQRDISSLLMNIFVFAMIPAVCEELFFRGFFQNNLMRVVPPHAAIWITSIVFSLIHFQAYGFVSRALLGGLLGYFAWQGRSLLPSIIAHFFFNLFSILLFYFSNTAEGNGGEISEETVSFPFIWVIASSVLVISGLLIYFRLSPLKSSSLHE